MSQSQQPNSHSFFYVVMFMTVVVLATVAAYFVFLPKSAPKQIILAVLPFGGPEHTPEKLRIGLPSDIRNQLALSRDLRVTDFQSSLDVFNAKQGFAGITEELGASHFVDGTFKELGSDLSATLEMRLVNVTQSAWKEVWKVSLRIESDEWITFAKTIPKTIREELYDQYLEHESTDFGATEDYLLYLEALSLFHTHELNESLTVLEGISSENRTFSMNELEEHTTSLSDGYLIDSREMYDGTLAKERLNEIEIQRRQSGDVERYKEELEELVTNYPNSVAVSVLADLYVAAGWYPQAKQLLYRWAQLRPRSFYVGVRLAQVDYLQGDVPGVNRALKIAERRSGNSQKMAYWLEILLLNLSTEYDPSSESNPVILLMKKGQEGQSIRYERGFHQTYSRLDCDSRIELALYGNEDELASQELACAQSKWLVPPVFWSIIDPRWINFVSSNEYEDHLSRIGIAKADLKALSPSDVSLLFMPQRS